ncbi:chaperonin 10-like protein [Podospora australis]|uniref:Chaperonin 10-like protein n=1 Tax=Podospora australis TaxID=1536484 RepID=A0AAN7AFK7_9PEZI|nr:chaperonin 10-like protein [Podospora australis]
MSPHIISLPVSRRAIIQDAQGQPQLVKDLPIPPLVSGTVLIKPAAVALNPSDYKMGAAFPSAGAIIGYDFAGTIIAVADNDDTENTCDFAPGDWVCGGVRGSNPTAHEEGGFASYIRASSSLLLRIPRSSPVAKLSIEQASTLATGLATCTLAIWDPTGLNLLPATPETPAEVPLPVLVYGGSTATGNLAIQLLKLSGFDPIATCSPRNYDLVRGAGASAVFDYSHPDVAATIKEHTAGRLKHVIDCISDARSVALCYEAIARAGGRYVSLELVADELLAQRRAVHASFLLGFEITGKSSGLPGGYGKPADPAKVQLGLKLWPIYQRLLNAGKLKPHPVQRLEGGLEGIVEGLALLKSGSVSGKKLVAVLEE